MLEEGSNVAAENIQSRLRGILVMAHANAQGRMAIATGNKSELAQGYCTLYGDMAGGYTPLGDVYKMEVYGLSEVFNRRAVERQPSCNVSKPMNTNVGRCRQHLVSHPEHLVKAGDIHSPANMIGVANR